MISNESMDLGSGMNHCRISVIIPAYNSAQFIERTLNTVLAQTASDFEIIVVDDGSEDDTCNIVGKKFQNVTRKNIQIRLIPQDHAGVSATRNLGLEHARGEYVMFFDSDDLMIVDCLEKFLLSVKDTKHDTVICGVDSVYENGKLMLKYSSRYDYFQKELSGIDVSKLFISGKIYICVENIIHRRTFLNHYNLKFTVGSPRGEDIEFNTKALFLSKSVACVPESLVKIVKRKGSISQNIPDIFESIKSMKRLRDFLAERPDSEEIIIMINTKRIPEGYISNFLTHIHAGHSFSEVIKIAQNEEIQSSFLNYHSDSYRKRLIFFMLLHSPKLLFITAKLKRKLKNTKGDL